MCGIAGFTHLDRRVSPDIIRAAVQSIVHRGPDQQGVWESDHVALGAVRLRIIDLEHGAQPMVSDDGNTVIVFNGEVYNHAELREELQRRGHRFDSRCDTEAVLRAFLEWDIASFSRLRGMFAFAVWQQREKRLLLVRDRLGIKPLYVYRRGDDLHFGSELKAIFADPSIERHLDAEGLWQYLSLNWIPGGLTMAEGVEKLEPGSYLEWRAGKSRQERYWSLSFAPDSKWTLGSAKEELDRLLRLSVEEHLVSDVPLGVWSSGGIDSSTMLHYASEAAGRKLISFSVSFRGRSFDESEYFREIAARYGTDHHEYDLQPESQLVDTIQRIAHYSDEPSADAGALPVWFLSRMCRSEVTVALSGDGGDELFGGYQTYLADRYATWLQIVPSGLRRLGLSLASKLPVSDEKIGLEYKIKRMLAGSLLPAEEAHLFWNGTFSEDEKRSLVNKSGVKRPSDLLRPDRAANQSGPLNRYMWVDQRGYLVDDILTKVDRMSMAHSLEVRPPFLDHRIVEFAATLPENLKINGSKLKYVLRELMRDKLPATILTRKKEGFDIPTHHWFRGVLRELLLDTVTERAARESGILEWRPIEALIERHMSRRANLGYHLWGLLILFLWMREWKIQPPRSVAENRLETVTN
jgi:asparagine synthase (glutamine-hydrolysing)